MALTEKTITTLWAIERKRTKAQKRPKVLVLSASGLHLRFRDTGPGQSCGPARVGPDPDYIS
jgi:hypothetical protein